MPMLSTYAVVAGERLNVKMYVHPEAYNNSDARESIERDLKARLVLNVIEKLDIRVRVESDPRDDLAAGGFTVRVTEQ